MNDYTEETDNAGGAPSAATAPIRQRHTHKRSSYVEDKLVEESTNLYEKNLRQTGQIIGLEEKNQRKKQKLRDIRLSAQKIAQAAESTD